MAEDKEDYIFTRDFMDNNRINLGHYQFTNVFGYLLHPKIPTSNPDLRVADVGTGTGLWLHELSTRLPDTIRLDGLDISLRASPPTEWLPKNMKFRQFNFREPVPEDLIGQFDIVHIRYLFLVVNDEDILKVTQNIARLLKPGGYLQWGEVDTLSFRIETTNPGNPTDALERLYRLESSGDDRMRPTWTRRLPNLFESAGLSEIETGVRKPKPWIAWQMHETVLMIHNLVALTTKNPEVANGLKVLLPQVVRETKQGAAWMFDRWVVIGKKPLSPS